MFCYRAEFVGGESVILERDGALRVLRANGDRKANTRLQRVESSLRRGHGNLAVIDGRRRLWVSYDAPVTPTHEDRADSADGVNEP